MLLFQPHLHAENNSNIILVFGIGLIGSAICHSLNRRGDFVSTHYPFRWNHPKLITNEAQHIEDKVVKIAGSTPTISQLSIVWSAGKAGFSATKDDVENEMENYHVVLDLMQQLMKRLPSISFSFHLVSSLGGLFEQQPFVNRQSIPSPMRPYGHLKHEQELQLFKFNAHTTKHIYRPTSVYGFYREGPRSGLISTLISNGLQNKVTAIFGKISTLRDYVLNIDIGRYIAGQLFHGPKGEKFTIHHLGSGKPCSIYEIQQCVENSLRKKIYLRFICDHHDNNVLNIALNPSLLPNHWFPTDVKTGVKIIKDKLLTSGSLQGKQRVQAACSRC